MNTGTRNIINRLKGLIKQTQDDIRRQKEHLRTPWEQRAPWGGPAGDLKLLASALCITRAAMRGKKHWPNRLAGEKPIDELAWLSEKLKKAEEWEAMMRKASPKSGPVHDKTFPAWMRATIGAALEAAKLEPTRREARQKRYESFKGKESSAA